MTGWQAVFVRESPEGSRDGFGGSQLCMRQPCRLSFEHLCHNFSLQKVSESQRTVFVGGPNRQMAAQGLSG